MFRRGSRLGRALLPAALVLGVSCGDDDADDGSATAPVALSTELLDGRVFLSTDVTGETLVDGTRVSLTFDGDTLSASAGCNTIFGGYELDDGTLTAGPLAQSQMLCEEDLQRQDEWVAELLENGPTVTLVEDVLTVSSATTSVTFQES